MCVRGDRVHKAVLEPAVQLPALKESALQHRGRIDLTADAVLFLQAGQRTAAGKASGKTITVTRAAASAEVTLSLAPADLRFDPAGTNRITVTSNASWSASCSDPALVFSPASGTGDGTITVTAAPEGVRCTLTVTAGEGPGAKTQSVEILYTAYRFPELASNWVQPSKDAAAGSGDYAFYTHWTTTVSSRKTVRNYSYCYDTRRHNPIWVAYPMHESYTKGTADGQNKDWKFDPVIPSFVQPDLSSSYKPSNSFSRGHMLASNDRQSDKATNRQTFYYTNMSPQIQTGFNGGIWATFEQKCHNMICSDTLIW